MKLIFAILGLVPALTFAADWRAGLELGDPEAVPLILAICAGLAAFWIWSPTADSQQRMLRLGICAAVLVAAVFFQPVRGLLALLAVIFLVYGFIRRT